MRLFERAGGIEPPFSAWKADVGPFNYARISRCVGDQGIEPCASRSQTERSTGELVPDYSAEGGSRTRTSHT